MLLNLIGKKFFEIIEMSGVVKIEIAESESSVTS